MIRVGANLHRLVSTFARVSGLYPSCRELAGHAVFRVGEANSMKDPWERRIVELSDGRPVTGIIDVLFSEELRAGAWAVDIGLWKNAFDRSVVHTIAQLASRGRIYLKVNSTARED
jgi:hypothetical protein